MRGAFRGPDALLQLYTVRTRELAAHRREDGLGLVLPREARLHGVGAQVHHDPVDLIAPKHAHGPELPGERDGRARPAAGGKGGTGPASA